MLRAEESGHQELEQRPQFEQVVFDGRTGQAQPHPGLDGTHRARRDGVRVLDVLRFVKDDRVEIVLFQLLKVAAELVTTMSESATLRNMPSRRVP